MECSVFLRQTQDYSNIDVDEHIKSLPEHLYWTADKYNEDGTTQLEKFITNVKRWKSYSIPYVRYRMLMQQMAKPNWSQTAPKVIRAFQPNHNLMLLPTDDDDFFAPNVVERVLPIFENPQVDLVVWDCCMVITTNEADLLHIQYIPYNDMVHTNSYMFRSTIPNAKSCAYNHMRAGEFAAQNPQKVVYLHEPLSLYNKHAAGHYLLSTEDFFPSPVGELPPIPKEMQWAKEYILKIYNLRKRLVSHHRKLFL